MDNDAISIGGDVELNSLEIFNHNNRSADIKLIFTEIELYEDIYSHSLSGSITIIDTHDLINKFPIIGEERIRVSFKTPGFPDAAEITHLFYVYKLTNIIVPNLHKQVYTLHFTTQETMTDLNKKVSKAFQGTPDKIIQRLLGADGVSTSKRTDLEVSSNNIKFVSPFWTPFKCINYAMSRAQSVDGFKASNFIFFETNKQYKFKSINSLFDKQNVPKVLYYYSNDPARVSHLKGSSRNVLAEMSKIYEMSIDEKFDMINRIDSGYYSHQMWDHNLLLKMVNKRQYDYKTDFSKTNHLEPHPVSSNNFEFSKNTLLSSVTTYPQSHDGILEDNYGKILTNKIPLMNQLEGYKLNITVNGRTDLEVGDVIHLDIGGIEILNEDDKSKLLDNTYNGRYIVLSIMHRVTIKKHQMILSVARESVKESYK
jgi:hypothetical protein